MKWISFGTDMGADAAPTALPPGQVQIPTGIAIVPPPKPLSPLVVGGIAAAGLGVAFVLVNMMERDQERYSRIR